MNEQRAVRNKNMILTNENLDTEEDVNNNKQNNVEAKINRRADKIREEMQLEEFRKQAKELGLEPYSTIPSDAATSERDNFAETESEKEKRMHIESYSEPKDGMYTLMFIRKIVIIALICSIVLLPLLLDLTSILSNSTTVDKGNPYNCSYCKYKNRACSNHKNYETIGKPKYLREKIGLLTYTMLYEKEQIETNIKFSYYNNSEYDNTCDFCKENKVECSGCKSTRLILQEKVYNEYKDYLEKREKEQNIKSDELSIEEINFIEDKICKDYNCSLE